MIIKEINLCKFYNNSGEIDVDIEFENEMRNESESEAEADVRNVDRNTNVASSTLTKLGNARIDVRLNS